MSRIDELKKQHKDLALSDLDLIKMAMPDQAIKYVEVLAKLTKSKYKEIAKAHEGENNLRNACLSTLTGWGIDYNYLETLETPVLWALWGRMETLLGQNSFKLFIKFANLNERKLISNNDVTSYSSWDEIDQAVSLAEMKLIDKKLEKEIKKVYEDDEWLSLRPLSLEASMKYGANTKWCTTTESGMYYARYSSRGILIYNINKKTGYKVACFKNLDPNHDNEFSWWDVTDRKIEALESEAPSVVLEAIRNEIKTTTVSNQMLMTKAESDKLEAYKEGNKYRVEPIEEPRLHISGGFNTTTSNHTLVFHPSNYTTTGNVGIGTINPTTQLQVNGDMAIDGDIVFRSGGEERLRLTSNGFEGIGASSTQQYNHFERTDEDTTRLIQELTREMNSGDRVAADAQQRLDNAMAEQLAEANERVAEKHLSLLENIELGTLDNDMKIKMQMLAGIKTTQMQIQELEADLERLRLEANQDEVIDDTIYDPTKDIQTSLHEAEQPVVHSKHNWINKIKSGYEKAKVYVTRSKMAKSTE